MGKHKPFLNKEGGEVMHSYKFKLTSILMLMIFTATALGGCGGSRARSVKHSGFLGDYSMLKKTDKEHQML